MGRIKPIMVNKAASQLFESVDGFSEDFDKNKKLLNGTIAYKSIRNKVAGAIVGLAKKRRQKEDAGRATLKEIA